MNAIDARLDAACKRHMKEWSLADFKESHPSLYCAIVEAIDIALHTPLSPAVPAPEPSKVEPWVAVVITAFKVFREHCGNRMCSKIYKEGTCLGPEDLPCIIENCPMVPEFAAALAGIPVKSEDENKGKAEEEKP